MTSSTTTSERDKHIGYLFDAELQFRLTSAIRIAVTRHRQPLDFPEHWTHGKYAVCYDEMALRQDQAEYAAQVLQHSATLTMAVAVKDAIEAVVPGLPKAVKDNRKPIRESVDLAITNTTPKPWTVSKDQVATSYHISRLIRNAYAHAPFAPRWKIQDDLRDKTFAIPDVIELRTRDLDGNDFKWQHYGGLLGLYQLCRFTRFKILGDENRPRQNIPTRTRALYQQGNLIIEKIDEIPKDSVRVATELRSDGSIDLGHGHVLRLSNPKEVANEQKHAPEQVNPENSNGVSIERAR